MLRPAEHFLIASVVICQADGKRMDGNTFYGRGAELEFGVICTDIADHDITLFQGIFKGGEGGPVVNKHRRAFGFELLEKRTQLLEQRKVTRYQERINVAYGLMGNG